MSLSDTGRVGYVLKRYPRYSETFIVNEILAHEAAGLSVDIFSLLYPEDGHFQEAIARVRACVKYLPAIGLRALDLWGALEAAGAIYPQAWRDLGAASGEDPRCVYQALVLAAEIGKRGITHLHSHFATDATTVARLAARFAGIPYTFTAHAKDIFHQQVDADDRRRKLADAAAVITVSDFNATYLRRHYGSAAGTVTRIYNGLDLRRFGFVEPAERPARIVAVGRLVEKKGFGDLVVAARLLADRGLDFDCEIIGSGPLEGELRGKIAALGLDSRVTLVGPRPQGEVTEHVRGAAVLAAPCVVGSDGDRDGLPTVLLEAMALGTPCVSTNVTGIPEALRDRDTGLMVQQRAPAQLAAALERLLTDPALRVLLAIRARRHMEAEFDIRRNAASLRAVLAASGRAARAGAETAHDKEDLRLVARVA